MISCIQYKKVITMPITAQYYDVPLRDGVKLATLVVRPDEHEPCPFIVIRSPYGGGRGGLGDDILEFCQNGLGFILQEARGTGYSEGEADLWRQEKQDAEDFLNWISEQPWFNGRLVTNGESYPGFTQWHAARNGHPVMVGLTPHNAPLDIYHGSYFSGGAYGLGLGCGWAFGMFAKRNKLTTGKSWKELQFHVPLKDLDIALYGKRWDLWQEWMQHPDFDSYWKEADGFRDMEKITAPAFITGGWYDLFLMQTLRAFTEIRQKGASPEARNYSRLVLEPLDHDMKTAEVDYGDHHLDGIIATRNRFMKNILLEPGKDPLPGHAPLRFFVMGSNQWMEADEWPLPQAEEKVWYLHGQSP